MTYSNEGPDHERWADVAPASAPAQDGSSDEAGGSADQLAARTQGTGGTGSTGGSAPPPHGSGGGWAGPGFPAGVAYRRRRYASPAVAALLVAGAAAASVGAGHYLWPASAADRTLSAAGSGGAATSPSNGSSSGSSPSYGSSPAGGSSPFASGGYPYGGYTYGGPGSSSDNSGTSPATGSPANVSAIAGKVAPGLVDINVKFDYQSASGAGTGIVLTSTGEVLTNNHVINQATSISATDIGNGRTYQAKVVGYDRTGDIAVLQLEGASGLPTARIGSSTSLKVGQGVVAIGNAGGTGGTPSSAGGSITALGQAITASDELDGTSEQLSGLIETNADVQSGDSGGPLVDRSGQVIGMDTAAATGYSLQSQTNQGYAIPVDTALAIAHQIESGRSSSTVHVGPTAFLGVTITSGSGGSGAYGEYGGNGAGSPATGGATVNGVVKSGAAANAGITVGDTITAVDGRSISSPAALSAAIGQDRPGQSVQLAWTDSSGQAHTATVDLGSGPPA